jgi:pimeloyl-ACP methyl ester carboxylesterase
MPSPVTIALLPGLLCDRAFYAAQIPAFEALAPTCVADFSTQSSFSAMAHSVLDSIEGPLAVIGHSMGGRVALEIIRQAPERVVALALMDTGVHPRREAEVPKREELVRLAYDKGMEALATHWLPPMVHPDRVRDEALLAPMRAMVMRASPQQHERQIRALLDRPDGREVLSQITCPTLVLVGRQDLWSPVAQHEEIAALVPGAELAIIEESGHMVLMEQPQTSEEALVSWLRRVLV